MTTNPDQQNHCHCPVTKHAQITNRVGFTLIAILSLVLFTIKNPPISNGILALMFLIAGILIAINMKNRKTNPPENQP